MNNLFETEAILLSGSAETPPKNGKRGGQPIYSDIAIETVILWRSGARDGPSGNVSLDTICRVTRKTHSIVTRESLAGDWEPRMTMLRNRKLQLVALS